MPPAPVMAPENVLAPALMTRVCVPSATVPLPARELTCGEATAETSSRPLSTTELEVATAVALPSSKVDPLAMVVEPV